MAERESNIKKRTAARAAKTRERNRFYIRVFSAFIVVCLSFVAGFLFRGNASFLQSLGFPYSVTGIEDKNAETSATQDVYRSVTARLAEVENVLLEDGMDSYNLDGTTNAVMEAFTKATDDPYLRYYDQQRYGQLLSGAEGYAGIGVMFSEYQGQAYAVDVFEGSAAQLSDVQPGDFVVAIDGDRSHSWSRSEVIAAINRAQGSTVVVTWRRPVSLESEGGTEFTTMLTCSTYTTRNIATSLNDGIGYIQLRQFTQNSSTMVETAIKELEAQNARAYVLDLRDNPGGYLNQAVNIASLFINSGTVVQIQTRDTTTVKSVSGTVATTKPLVVLVNQNSAASSEVLAAALKETQRGVVIGLRTLGKGSVQVVHDLSYGGAIRYTAAYYLTAQGHAIEAVGVYPDITVTNGAAGDAQLDYALEYAQTLVAG